MITVDTLHLLSTAVMTDISLNLSSANKIWLQESTPSSISFYKENTSNINLHYKTEAEKPLPKLHRKQAEWLNIWWVELGHICRNLYRKHLLGYPWKQLPGHTLPLKKKKKTMNNSKMHKAILIAALLRNKSRSARDLVFITIRGTHLASLSV